MYGGNQYFKKKKPTKNSPYWDVSYFDESMKNDVTMVVAN
jgi:hypothetical protein